MIDTPIRKKVKNYPKDFTPPPGYLFSTRNINPHPTESSTSGQQSRSVALIGMQPFNKSTQLAETTIEDKKNITITINPQQAVRLAGNTEKQQVPLVNLHISRRRPYINPQLLTRPRIEEKVDEDLLDGQQSDGMDQSTPGTIRKNVCQQRPLQAEHPNNLTIPSKQFVQTLKVESNQNIFVSSLKQYPNYTNHKQKRLPTFLKVPSTQQGSRFKLPKRQASFNFSESYFRTPKEKQMSEEKDKLNQLGSLLEQNQISKLKAHINKIVIEKSKQKQKIGNPHQTQADFDTQTNSKRNFRSQFNFTSRVRQGNRQESQIEIGQDQEGEGNRWEANFYQNKKPSMRANSTPKSSFVGRKFTITYKKTSLNTLKQIYSSIRQAQNAQIQVLIPDILMNINLSKNTQKYELYSESALIFESLGIPVQNLTVKRYSNCVMMLSKNICILWHYDGKVYLGGWQVKYLDEGFKHGLGLQWVPNKHLYYGEFTQGKKEGLGVMRTQNQVFIGEWMRGKRTDTGYLINQSGEVLNGRDNLYGDTQEYESDPFL